MWTWIWRRSRALIPAAWPACRSRSCASWVFRAASIRSEQVSRAGWQRSSQYQHDAVFRAQVAVESAELGFGFDPHEVGERHEIALGRGPFGNSPGLERAEMPRKHGIEPRAQVFGGPCHDLDRIIGGENDAFGFHVRPAGLV